MTRDEAAAKLTDEVFWRALQSNMAWPPKVGWDAASAVILDALGLPEQEPTCATCQHAYGTHQQYCYRGVSVFVFGQKPAGAHFGCAFHTTRPSAPTEAP